MYTIVYLKSPLGYTLLQILGKRFLDEIKVDLFSGAHNKESQKKSIKHDLPKCVPEWPFEIKGSSTYLVSIFPNLSSEENGKAQIAFVFC